jgi:hypothetical protein
MRNSPSKGALAIDGGRPVRQRLLPATSRYLSESVVVPLPPILEPADRDDLVAAVAKIAAHLRSA